LVDTEKNSTAHISLLFVSISAVSPVAVVEECVGRERDKNVHGVVGDGPNKGRNGDHVEMKEGRTCGECILLWGLLYEYNAAPMKGDPSILRDGSWKALNLGISNI
jgi:hypothetical protein